MLVNPAPAPILRRELLIPEGWITHMDAYGISLGQGAYARPRGADNVYYGHNSRLAAMLGLTDPGEYNPVSALATPYRNRCSGGANLIWHSDGSSYARVLQDHDPYHGTKDQTETLEAWPAGQRRLVTINSGVADLFKVAQGGDNDDPRVTIPKVAMAHAVVIARLRSAYMQIAPDSGTFGAYFAGEIYGNSGNGIYAATAEGQTLIYDLDPLPEGAAVTIIGLHSNAWWSDWIINGQAEYPATYRPTQPDKISGWCVRRVVGEDLPADEPITIECEANDLSTFGVIDSINVESPYRDRQPILVHGAVKWHSPTIAYFGASTADRDAALDEMSDAIEAVVDVFAYEGQNDVLFVPLEPMFDKRDEFFLWPQAPYVYDGIHWVDAAHQATAVAGYDAIQRFVQRGGRI